MGKRSGWSAFARACAREAHEENFSSRRGIYCVEDAKNVGGDDNKPEDAVLVIYNNNPYAARAIARDWEVEEFRKLLAEEGIEELGYGEYPDTGPGEGYSYAIVIDATKDQEDRVSELAQQAALTAFRRMDAEKS